MKRRPVTDFSNITVPRIVINAFTGHHIQKIMRRTTFHTQTVLIDTYRESADQTVDKRPLTWVKVIPQK